MIKFLSSFVNIFLILEFFNYINLSLIIQSFS